MILDVLVVALLIAATITLLALGLFTAPRKRPR
jgi:hypothetical protein